MKLVLDTGILGQLCHPGNEKNQAVCQWLTALLNAEDQGIQIILPEICDYELRRKLLHLIRQGQATAKSIGRLDDLTRILDYLPLETQSMHKAAELWADVRSQGLPTAPNHALDGDVILAAQAILVDGIVVTSNRKHLSRFVTAKDWSEIEA